MLHSRLFYSPILFIKYLLSGRVVRESPGYRFACCPGYIIFYIHYTLTCWTLATYIILNIYFRQNLHTKWNWIDTYLHVPQKQKQAKYTHTTHGWIWKQNLLYYVCSVPEFFFFPAAAAYMK